MSDCFLGIDLGGTNIKAVAINADGTVLARGQSRTPATKAEDVVAEMAALGKRVAGDQTIAGAGVTAPAVVDSANGVVKYMTNIPGTWSDRPIARELEPLLQTRVAVLNDARSATYGELHFGAGRGCRHLVMVTVGTGIGGGVVVNGELYQGAHGHAGEVGHQLIDLHGPRCGCGGWGCAEAMASGPALASAGMRAVSQGMTTLLREMCGGDLNRITPRLVADAAAAGDPVALELLEEEGHRLGTVIGNLVVVLNPERVIVGGGVAQAGELLLVGVRRTLEQRLQFYLPHAPVEVVAAELGDESGALGAAAWGRRHAQSLP